HRTDSRDYAIFGGKGGGGGVGGLLGSLLGRGLDWVMDTMINPAVDAIVGQMPDNMMGAFGKGSILKIRDAVKKKLEDFIKRMKERSPSNVGGGGGAQQWSGTVSQALKMLGLPDSWLGPTLTLIERESGGNPNAINLSDSNAAAGMPSQGLMQ